MKILIGVDGSPSSLEAVSLVGRLIDPRADEVAIYFSPAELQRRVPWGQTLVEGASKALFDEAEGRLPQPFTRPVEVIVSTKSAAAGILEAAIGWKADLVVVGASNQTSLERFLLGSVSRAVVHGSTLPVLVVRNAPAASESIRPIACYLAASAAAVAAVVSKLRWPADTSGEVIGVAESLLAGPLPSWLERKVRDPQSAAIASARTGSSVSISSTPLSARCIRPAALIRGAKRKPIVFSSISAGSTCATRISARSPGRCVRAKATRPSRTRRRFSRISGTQSATVASATRSRS